MNLKDRITSSGPKRILALDAGGIRGALTIEVLAAMESKLATKLGRVGDFVLSDYFDFVAGTSTGAIIATCISLGMRVDAIRKFYVEHGREMFDPASLLKRFHYRFEDDKLAELLKSVIGADTLLGSDKLRTVLLCVMRNATTDSPWPVSNNPFAKYNQPSHPDCNLRIPLWQLVRASTAAPTYFPPEVVDLGMREFLFVDGGITMYNNPAFMAFLMATLEPYCMNWKTGEDALLIVSVGTGSAPDSNAELKPGEMNYLYNAQRLPSALMYAALNEQDMLCRVFGRCINGASLDREIGDLCQARGPLKDRLFTYARYNAELTSEWFAARQLEGINADAMRALDAVENIASLQRVGRAVANQIDVNVFI